MEKLKRRQFLKLVGGSVIAAALPVSAIGKSGPARTFHIQAIDVMDFKRKLEDASNKIASMSEAFAVAKREMIELTTVVDQMESGISMEIWGEQLYGGGKVKFGTLIVADPDSFVTLDKPVRNITGVISQAAAPIDCEISIGDGHKNAQKAQKTIVNSK